MDRIVILQAKLEDAEREARTARVSMAHAMERAENLEAENFRLAAGACIVDGGLVGDEGGTPVCTLQKRLDATEYVQKLEDMRRQRDETRREFQEWREKYSASFGNLDASLVKAVKELGEARETITRLNRRAQVAEAAVGDNLEACQSAGLSFSKSLANVGFSIMKRQRDEALKALEPFSTARTSTVKFGDHEIVAIAYDEGCSAAVKHFEEARRVVKELKDG